MRHKHGYRKLGRDSAHRKALLRNLATALIINERITTTLPKAKELRGYVEKLVTLGKKGSLHHRRQAAEVLFEKPAVAKVFGELAGRFKERQGGYVRVLKSGLRAGDGAKMAIIEFVDYSPTSKA